MSSPEPRASSYTNRSWFVRGPDGAHSRTIHERVAALVSLTASMTTADTRQPIMFSGHVTPNHAVERVFLQDQKGTTRRLVDTGEHPARPGLELLDHPSLADAWRARRPRSVPPATSATSRVRPIRSSITIQQHQVAGFHDQHLRSRSFTVGQSATISGKLYMPGTTTPEPNTRVTLCGKIAGTAAVHL